VFSISADGKKLTAWDEHGAKYCDEQITAITAEAALRCGMRKIALTGEAPYVIEKLGRRYSANAVIQEGTEEYAEVMKNQRFMRDGIYASIVILAALNKGKISFAELCGNVPHFSTEHRRVDVACSRAKAMELLRSSLSEMATELTCGLAVDSVDGRARIYPDRESNTILIRGESTDEKAAKTICDNLEKLISNTDDREK
jgi:phosphomannomutase